MPPPSLMLLTLAFDGIPGFVYHLQYIDNLSGSAWQDVGSQSADDFGVCSFTELPESTTGARFYRAVWP